MQALLQALRVGRLAGTLDGRVLECIVCTRYKGAPALVRQPGAWPRRY